jgi:hypothetical protein
MPRDLACLKTTRSWNPHLYSATLIDQVPQHPKHSLSTGIETLTLTPTHDRRAEQATNTHPHDESQPLQQKLCSAN